MHLRRFIHKRPNSFYIPAAALASALGLGLAPSLGPLVILLSILLLYAPILAHRPHKKANTALVWLTISLFGSIGRLSPTLSALSSAGPSIAILLALSAVSTALAIFTIRAEAFLRARTVCSHAALFPAIWMTLWAVVGHAPLGRLTAWSPMLGTDSYAWMAPWFGAAGLDWVVAAWAVVVSQTVGVWLMGMPDSDEDEENAPSKYADTTSTWVLFGVLTLLTLPSYFVSDIPYPLTPIESTTPLTVGCALPSYSKFDVTRFGIDDYIKVSKTMSNAKIVLWPEGAVSFRNETERTAAFQDIAGSMEQQGTYWAVSFDETLRLEDDKRISRTGIAILEKDKPVPKFEYYKRDLVPIAESFHFTPGSSPPGIFSFNLVIQPAPGKPRQSRPITISASICLDYTMPNVFESLLERPTLLLAPGNTWDRTIGKRMWHEVKQRANELGTTALWCDGGEGAVSGVAGGGYNDVTQTGAGPWTRTIGIPHPFNTKPTFYARFGSGPALALAWFAGLGMVGAVQLLVNSNAVHRATGLAQRVARRLRPRTQPEPEPQPPLIDI